MLTLCRKCLDDLTGPEHISEARKGLCWECQTGSQSPEKLEFISRLKEVRNPRYSRKGWHKNIPPMAESVISTAAGVLTAGAITEGARLVKKHSKKLWRNPMDIHVNPGAKWHDDRAMESYHDHRESKSQYDKEFHRGKLVAHMDSRDEARRLNENPKSNNYYIGIKNKNSGLLVASEKALDNSNISKYKKKFKKMHGPFKTENSARLWAYANKVKVMESNPGIKWHKKERSAALERVRHATNRDEKYYYLGLSGAHITSIAEIEKKRKIKSNPWKIENIDYSKMKKHLKNITGFTPERFAQGFLVSIKNDDIKQELKKHYRLKNIGIGYDYNAKVLTLLAYPKKLKQNPRGELFYYVAVISKKDKTVRLIRVSKVLTKKESEVYKSEFKKMIGPFKTSNAAWTWAHENGYKPDYSPNPPKKGLSSGENKVVILTKSNVDSPSMVRYVEQFRKKLYKRDGFDSRVLSRLMMYLKKEIIHKIELIEGNKGQFNTIYWSFSKGSVFDTSDFKELESDLRNALKEKRKTAHYSSNPPKKGAVEIYDNVLAIEAEKGNESLWPREKFRHDFKKNKGRAKIYGLSDGSILIKGEKKLWKKFDY